MLVCSVSYVQPKTIAAAIAETVKAVDLTATTSGVLATLLVDDPAAAVDSIDAYLGEILLEATSAADVVSAGSDYVANINEAATAASAEDFLPASFATLNGTPTGGVVVSGGGLIATHTSTTNSVGVASTAFKSTGKYYFEGKIEVSFQNNNAVGLMKSTGTPADLRLGTNTIIIQVGSGSCFVYSNSAILSGSLGSAAVNDTFGLAVDLTNRLFWGRRNNGNWNASGTADPATGTGGFTIPVGSFAPAVEFTGAGATDRWVLNFGQSAFFGTAPSGFGYWTN